MADVIDIEILIDAQSILAAYPHPSQDPTTPTVIADDSCYMVGQPAAVRSGQATAHLHIDAHRTGAGAAGSPAAHAIRWRALSLSGNAGHSAIVYDIVRLSRTSVASPVAAVEAHPEVPLPSLDDGRNTDPPSFGSVAANDYFLEAHVVSNGTERFGVQFYIAVQDDETGEPTTVGYFEWHPAVTLA